MNNNELDTGTYQLTSTPTPNKARTTIYYTAFGNHNSLLKVLKDDKQLEYPVLSDRKDKNIEYAIHESVDNTNTYFVRLDPNGDLFNVAQSKSINDRKTRILKNEPQYLKVNQNCFNSYIEYLRTLNPLHLKFAEQSR